MKYNLTSELVSTELLNWANDYVRKHPTPSSEFYPPALFVEATQTLDKDLDYPKNQNQIKYVYSKRFRPYSLFKMHWSKLTPRILHVDTAYATEINVRKELYANEIKNIQVITSQSINVDEIAKISSLLATSITSYQEDPNEITLRATLGIIPNLRGDLLDKYTNAKFGNGNCDPTDPNHTGITVTQLAQLTAFCAKWADMAEYYRGDEEYEYGTLVEFSGENEVSKATKFVNGCVSEKPAIVLNSAIRTEVNSVPIVLVGKTKVKAKGPINKFDRIELSDEPGIARKYSNKTVIGIALESNDDEGIKLVNCIIKMTL